MAIFDRSVSWVTGPLACYAAGFAVELPARGWGSDSDLPALAADARAERVDVRPGAGHRAVVPCGGGPVRAGHARHPPPPGVSEGPGPGTGVSP